MKENLADLLDFRATDVKYSYITQSVISNNKHPHEHTIMQLVTDN